MKIAGTAPLLGSRLSFLYPFSGVAHTGELAVDKEWRAADGYLDVRFARPV